ncbi:hypothetical protein H0H87_004060, partial [Tephrocybe sp. NHM501043]
KEPVCKLHRNTSVPEDLDFGNVSEETDSAPVISKTVLSLAQHLGNLLGQNICLDPHINKTCHLKLAYGAEKSIDVLINHAQLKNLQEPVSRSIWKLIILDKYVDFKHLHAVLDCSYDHDNKAKNFSAGFAIVKKDTLSRKKVISTKSNGSGFLMHREQLLWYSLFTGTVNYLFTKITLSGSLKLLLIYHWLYLLTTRFASLMQNNLSA